MADYSAVMDVRRFNAFLSALTAGAPTKAIVFAVAVYFKAKVNIYPSESHRPQPFVSDKQRRGFFAKLNAGEIEVPYKRGMSPNSETASKRWTVEERDGGNTQVVGNSASYAPLLYSKASQTLYHKQTGWRDVETVYRDEKQNLAKVAREAAQQNIRALARR